MKKRVFTVVLAAVMIAALLTVAVIAIASVVTRDEPTADQSGQQVAANDDAQVAPATPSAPNDEESDPTTAEPPSPDEETPVKEETGVLKPVATGKVPAESAVVELLDADMDHVAYAASVESALAMVSERANRFTVRLLRDLDLSQSLRLVYESALSAGATEWTFDGKDADGVTHKLVLDGNDYALKIYSPASHVTVKNLTIVSATSGVHVIGSSDVTLENADITVGKTVDEVATSSHGIYVTGGKLYMDQNSKLVCAGVSGSDVTVAALLIEGDSSVCVIDGEIRAAQKALGVLIRGHKDRLDVTEHAVIASEAGYCVQLPSGANLNNNTVNIYGGLLTTATGTRTLLITQDYTACNIYGGTIEMATALEETTQARAIWMNGTAPNSSVNIYGGTIKGGNHGERLVGASTGKMLIEGGTLLGNGGSTIFVESGFTDLTIRGGTLIGGKAQHLFEFNCACQVLIEDGEFSAPENYTPSSNKYMFSVGKATVTVKGGNFSAIGGLIFRISGDGGSMNPVTIDGGTFYTTMHFMYVAAEAARPIVINDCDVTVSGSGSIFRFKDGKSGAVVVNGGHFLSAGKSNSVYVDPKDQTKSSLTVNGGLFEHTSTSPMIRLDGPMKLTINGGEWNQMGPVALIDVMKRAFDIPAKIELNGGKLQAVAEVVLVEHNAYGELVVNDGVELVSGAGSAIKVNDSMQTAFFVTVNGGSVKGCVSAISYAAGSRYDPVSQKEPVLTINGGSFAPSREGEMRACLVLENGKCIVNGGDFVSDGAAVLLVSGGEADGDSGKILKTTTAELHVKNGNFTLLESAAEGGAVIVCGTAYTYGKAYVYDGNFVNEAGDLIFVKNNRVAVLVDKT